MNPLTLASFIPSSVFLLQLQIPCALHMFRKQYRPKIQLTKSSLCVAKHTSLYIAVPFCRNRSVCFYVGTLRENIRKPYGIVWLILLPSGNQLHFLVKL